MDILSQLNSPAMYLICGGIIFFVALVCVFFMVRAYRAGVAIGMDKTKMKRTITASATFAALPSVGILLGVIALSGSLGTPWSWLRLSVIGALHYETSVADIAARSIGLTGLSAAEMTTTAFPFSARFFSSGSSFTDTLRLSLIRFSISWRLSVSSVMFSTRTRLFSL